MQLFRRAAGKPPAYLIKRGLQEIQRRAGRKRLLKRARRIDAAGLARRCGVDSCRQIWAALDPQGFLLNSAHRRSVAALLRQSHPGLVESLRSEADRILRHEFDLLGSGPVVLGSEIDWHLDFKSGRRWELTASTGIDYAELDRTSDVKVPWELSRCRHLVTLGRAWNVLGDPRLVEEFRAQVQSWVRANPIGRGVNWACTMDVALRAVNWVVALALFQESLDDPFWETILTELYRHGLWISENLEFGAVNGNHFISDALGLVACGAVLGASPAAGRWLETGKRLLEEEILLQVDREGVNIEASVPYHRLALEIFLTGRWLLEAAGKPVSEFYDDRLRGMFDYVHAYTTPDGLTPVIGDADDGRVLALGEPDLRDHRYLLAIGGAIFGRRDWEERAGGSHEPPLWLAPRDSALQTPPSPPPNEPGPETKAMAESGFYVFRRPDQYLFIDAGPVGFKGLGGHGHNDCLSFEWHALGHPLLTDSGAYVYTASVEWRNRFRSTEYHNTIRIDRQEINRLPSPEALWTLRDDARPVAVRLFRDGEWDVLEAGHDGYRRLPDPVTVYRTWRVHRRTPALRLLDRLEGVGRRFVEIFFHAAPGADPFTAAKPMVGFRWGVGLECLVSQIGGEGLFWESRRGWFSPSYGVKRERPVWVAQGWVHLPFEVAFDLSVRIAPTGDDDGSAPGEGLL